MHTTETTIVYIANTIVAVVAVALDVAVVVVAELNKKLVQQNKQNKTNSVGVLRPQKKSFKHYATPHVHTVHNVDLLV